MLKAHPSHPDLLSAHAIAALIRRIAASPEDLRVIAAACACAARELDADTEEMVEAFDAASDASVRAWTDAERQAHAASYYAEMKSDAAREAAHG